MGEGLYSRKRCFGEEDLRDGMKCSRGSIYIGGWGRRRVNGY